MGIVITGNPEKGLASELVKLYPEALFVSRANGYELCDPKGLKKFERIVKHNGTELIILNSALWRFQQTVLLDLVYRTCLTEGTTPHIISIGSTTDRVKKGGAWLYNAEKKALRDYSNTLGINGVWSENIPKVSYISFGTMSNNQEKHPERKCLPIETCAQYIKWVADQPRELTINEISIDAMQGDNWYE